MALIGVVVSYLAGLLLSYKRKELSIFEFSLSYLYYSFGAVIGAKLLYIIVSIGIIDWSEITFSALMRRGFVYYGSLIGGLISLVLFNRLYRVDLYLVKRDYIFLIPLFHFFGRIGCYLSGCCYGILYDGPLAVTFPEGSDAYAFGLSRFPTQLLEAFVVLLIAIFIFFFFTLKKREGALTFYLVSYPVARFFIEFLRGDDIRGHLFGLSTSQWISLAILLVVLFYYVYKRASLKKSQS